MMDQTCITSFAAITGLTSGYVGGLPVVRDSVTLHLFLCNEKKFECCTFKLYSYLM